MALSMDFSGTSRNDSVALEAQNQEGDRLTVLLYGHFANVAWKLGAQVIFKLERTFFVELARDLSLALRDRSDFAWDPADWGEPVLFFWSSDGGGPRIVTKQVSTNKAATWPLAGGQEEFVQAATEYIRLVRDWAVAQGLPWDSGAISA